MPRLSLPSGPAISYREVLPMAPDEVRRPPLLLLHGAGGSSLSFAEVLGQLGPLGRRALAVDLPGHGASPAFRRRPHPRDLLERYRDVVAELGEVLGLGRFQLVGHSMGGAVAQLFALAYPERLSGLVLIATAARLKVSPALLSAIRERFDQLPDLLAEAGFSPALDSALARSWAARQVQAPQEVVLADFEACARFDLRDRIGTVSCPALVVSAADDRLTPPKLQQQLSAMIPGSQHEELSRAGHLLVWERPDRLAALINTLKG
jgi:pimeloyl-ACP methyl ester carboxylesterase